MNNPCGLYIHIPFCSGKCPYCSFFSKIPCNTETENYVSQLIRLIEHYSAVYSDKVFDTMYIGGGTPSVIGTEKLCRIVEKSMDCFNVSSPEITVEMNPTSAQHIDFERLAKSGVNRISLGVQSSDEQELKLLGRKHNCCTVKKSVDMIRSAGIHFATMSASVVKSEANGPGKQKTIRYPMVMTVVAQARANFITPRTGS